MPKRNATGIASTNNADGFEVIGGTTERKLSVAGADININGTGTNTYTFPATSTTLAGLGTTQTFTGDKTFDGKVTFDKAVVDNPFVLTDAATINTDASQSNRFRVTLGGNRTLAAPSNPSDGQQCVWEFIQDATGSRTITLDTGTGGFAFGTDIVSITLTTTANKRDFMTATYSSALNKWLVLGFLRGY